MMLAVRHLSQHVVPLQGCLYSIQPSVQAPLMLHCLPPVSVPSR